MTRRFDAFTAEFEALCRKYRVQIMPTDDDGLSLVDLDVDDYSLYCVTNDETSYDE